MLRDTTSRAGLRCFSVVVRGQLCTFVDEHTACRVELQDVQAEIRSTSADSDYQYRLVRGLESEVTEAALSERVTAYWRHAAAQQWLIELLAREKWLRRRIRVLAAQDRRRSA